MMTRLNIVFLFPGQGSQYRGMGESLFREHPVFRRSMEEAELIVQQQLDRSLIHELYVEKQPGFDDLLITHPAIVAVEIALCCVLESMGVRPDYISGNSLGEFAAAVAAGVWDAPTALGMAIEQAKSIVRKNIPGGMMAVLHERTGAMEALYQEHGLYLASDNFGQHFTLSGSPDDLERFGAALQRLGVQCLRLPVAHPFHSPLIDGGAPDFDYHASMLPALNTAAPGFIAGLTAEETGRLSGSYFWEAVSRYTNFPRVVRYLEGKGPCLCIDLGPSGTAATFVKYNLGAGSSARTFEIMTPYKKELQRLEALGQMLSAKDVQAV